MNYDISDVTYHEIVDQYYFKISNWHIYNIYGINNNDRTDKACHEICINLLLCCL